jgi:hypothetical protein
MNALNDLANKRARTATDPTVPPLAMPTSNEISEVKDCLIEAFDAPSNEELKEFIHVRKWKSTRIPRSSQWKWPNKRTVALAQNGEHSLILCAFQLCEHPVIFEEEVPTA